MLATRMKMAASGVGGGDDGIKQNLLVYWSMDEGSAGTRIDSHSGSYDLTDNNTNIDGVAGKVSNCAEYNDEIEMLYNTSENLSVKSSDFSISLWAMFTDLADHNGNQLIQKRGNSTTDDREYMVDEYNNLIRFVIYDGTSAKQVATFSATVEDIWYHIVCRWNHTTKLQELIINDGTPITATRSGIDIDPVAHQTTRLGRAVWGQGHIGKLDEVAIWKRVITNDEVEWLYNSGSGRAYADM